jgi:spermidine synthase
MSKSKRRNKPGHPARSERAKGVSRLDPEKIPTSIEEPGGHAPGLIVQFSFACTIFLGAFLLFQVQLVIAKFILPWFGGGPGVWTTCMLFFQVLLLGGYAYAHLTSRRLKLLQQILVHVILLGAALALLPITPGETWKPRGDGQPVLEILALLAANIGLPYLVLSATSPLLQHWFSRSHPGASPYRLFALSNAGSLLALISYPFFFETHFTRKSQATLWAWGLGIYAIGCAACAFLAWKAAKADVSKPEIFGTPQRSVIPLLWVLPLALYLLSFVVTFDHPRWYRRFPATLALIAALAGICWAIREHTWPVWQTVLVYSGALFVCCLVCHGELYRLRPHPKQLTGFYLTIAAGGALGGIFVAVIAPLIFVGYHELYLGALLCPVLFLIACLRDRDTSKAARWCRMAGAFGILVLSAELWFRQETFTDRPVFASRNFYGVLRVFDHGQGEPPEHILWVSHGLTLHGAQFTDPAKSAWPTIYYGEESGVGLALHALPAGGRRLGLVGLGAGTLATYARPEDSVHFYEIDPEMSRLASSVFTYVTNCRAKLELTAGDARLSLERQTPQEFDLLALDAFSSDAIPVHLLTVEAFEVYGRHLKTNGVIAVHISNKWLDLEPVLANVAVHFDYQMVVIDHLPAADQWWLRRSTWALLTHNADLFNAPAIRAAARPAAIKATNVPLWTDNFSSLFRILEPN